MVRILLRRYSSTNSQISVYKKLQREDGNFYRYDFMELLKSRGLHTILRGPLYKFMQQLNAKPHFSSTELCAIVETLEPRSQNLLERAIDDDLAVVDWPKFTSDLKTIYDTAKACPLEVSSNLTGTFTFTNGKQQASYIPDYIPQLGRVDKDAFAISVCTVDGQRFHIGDYDTFYTMQSTSKPFFYSIAHALLGDKLHDYVGHEPSGRAFNEICLDNYNRPFNPMINMGAIMVSSLIKPDLIIADRFDFIRNTMKEFCAGRHVFCDMAIYKSEMEVGYKNKAAINYMMSQGCFNANRTTDTDLAEILDLYYQLCSLEITVKTQSIMGACIANGGVNPLNFKRIIPSLSTVRTLSLMYSSGMYDYSGKFAFKYGVPAKSGVSGATFMVVPGVLAMTIYNPWLGAESGSSVRGLEVIDNLNKKYPFHMFGHANSFAKAVEFKAESSLEWL